MKSLVSIKQVKKRRELTLSFLGAEMIEEPPTPYLQLVYTVVSKSGRRVSLTGMTEKEMRSYAHDIVIAIKMLTEKEVRVHATILRIFAFFCILIVVNVTKRLIPTRHFLDS